MTGELDMPASARKLYQVRRRYGFGQVDFAYGGPVIRLRDGRQMNLLIAQLVF